MAVKCAAAPWQRWSQLRTENSPLRAGEEARPPRLRDPGPETHRVFRRFLPLPVSPRPGTTRPPRFSPSVRVSTPGHTPHRSLALYSGARMGLGGHPSLRHRLHWTRSHSPIFPNCTSRCAPWTPHPPGPRTHRKGLGTCTWVADAPGRRGPATGKRRPRFQGRRTVSGTGDGGPNEQKQSRHLQPSTVPTRNLHTKSQVPAHLWLCAPCK